MGFALPDGLWGAVQAQESSNRPGVVGQRTPYGTPLGIGQMLPSTGQQVAGELGVPWQPGLMTGKSPQATAYQQTLGQRYLWDGYQASNGDARQALEYYYGGPNQKMWGPKTNAYADQVMARWQQQQPPADPYYSQGGQSPMPATLPSARPLTSEERQGAPIASLGTLANPQSGNVLAAYPPNQASPSSQSAPTQYPSLGALAASPGSAPQAKPHNLFTLANILGIAGDAFRGMAGQQPTFGPFLQQQQVMQQEQAFEREKFNQELQMKLWAMSHPQPMMEAIAYHNAPQAVRQAMVDYTNSTNAPVVGVQQPNGSIVNQIVPRKMQYQKGDIYTDPHNGQRYQKVSDGPDTDQASWSTM